MCDLSKGRSIFLWNVMANVLGFKISYVNSIGPDKKADWWVICVADEG